MHIVGAPHTFGSEGRLSGGGDLEAETARKKRSQQPSGGIMGGERMSRAGEGHAERPGGEKEPAVSVRP